MNSQYVPSDLFDSRLSKDLAGELNQSLYPKGYRTLTTSFPNNGHETARYELPLHIAKWPPKIPFTNSNKEQFQYVT